MPAIDIALYPVAIVQDRYNGAYSQGTWLAVRNVDQRVESGETVAEFVLNDGPSGGDCDAMIFWSDPPNWIAVGETPDEALKALQTRAAIAPVPTLSTPDTHTIEGRRQAAQYLFTADNPLDCAAFLAALGMTEPADAPGWVAPGWAGIVEGYDDAWHALAWPVSVPPDSFLVLHLQRGAS